MKNFVLLTWTWNCAWVWTTSVVLIVSATISIDPNVGISFSDLARSHGFQVDTHLVTTEDGYILTLQRVINPTMLDRLSKLKPVILNAGIGETGIDFMVNSPFLYPVNSSQNMKNNKTKNNENGGIYIEPMTNMDHRQNNNELGDNLGFTLALTERYDVWVSNSRGIMRTVNQHINLTTRDSKFWAFSWDEMGRYDLPAVIDYVLAETDRTTLSYVGFSEGTTSLYVLLSMRPEYAEKIEPAISLGPVAYLSHMKSPVRFITPRLLGLCSKERQFFLSKRITDILLSYLCPFDVAHLICQNLMFAVTGFDYENFNATRVPVYFSHYPGPISNREICHYLQLYRTKRFTRYDFGSESVNKAHYGQPMPPDYPLERIGNVTMAFFIGKNDFFTAPSDVDSLQMRLEKSGATLLPNYIIDPPHWSHISFVFGVGAGRFVYKDLIQVLDRYMLDY